MARNDKEDTAVLEKPKGAERPLEKQEQTVEELEDAFQDERVEDAQILEQGAVHIRTEADELTGGKEEFDPALKESLTKNAAEAQQIPPRFKNRIKAIEESAPTETKENIEKYVLDQKESGASLERENIAEYQKTLAISTRPARP